MQLSKANILRQGEMITRAVPEPHCECLFTFQVFRFFFSKRRGRNSPNDLNDSSSSGLPDYILDIVHQLVVVHNIFVDVLELPDIFKEGRFYNAGVRYLDIYLDNIPVEHGIASTREYSSTEPVLAGRITEDKSLKLILHRSLPAHTRTPVHELFHLFQYAITPFNNIWFMEGLARWAQQLIQLSPAREETLPLDRYTMESLLTKWHDAESFWNRLDHLCRKESRNTLPDTLAGCELPINTQVLFGGFMQTFLKHCRARTNELVQEQYSRQLTGINVWPRLEKRSANNNPYIFRAIMDAVEEQRPLPEPELDAFLKIAKSYAYVDPAYFCTSDIQALMRLLQKLEIGHVYLREDGFLVSDYFEPMTGALSCKILILNQNNITEKELQPLCLVRVLIGSLDISDLPELTSITGLENLESIEGSLRIDGTGIHSLNGFNQLERVKGKVEISNNPSLRFINGFNTIQTIDHELVISQNPQLESINGFNALRDIKKGAMIIENSANLSVINGFSSLRKTMGIVLRKLGISDVNFLANLFKQQPHFGGAIKITGCRLSKLGGLSGLVSTKSSLYLHANQLENLGGLESLVEVGASFSLSSNRLSDISQLSSLTRINGMLGLAYNRLITLDGLQNLKYLKTVKWGHQFRTLIFQGNPELSDISALANVVESTKNLIAYTDKPPQYSVQPGPTAPFYENTLQIYDTSIQDAQPVKSFKSPQRGTAPAILFPSMGSSWTVNILKNSFCRPCIFDFTEVGSVVSYCRENNLNVAFPTTISALKFLQKHGDELLRTGIKFLVPGIDALNVLENKRKFYQAMVKYGFGKYVPEMYDNTDTLKFPCIKKNESGSGGKHQVIVHDKESIGTVSGKELFCEYFMGDTEYATNILFVNNKVNYHVTFEKKTNSEFYILGVGDNRYSAVANKLVNSQFIDLFEQILIRFKYQGFCCFDYKIVNGIPKIFEINPRLGYSNSLHADALFNSIKAYYGAVSTNNFDYVCQHHDQRNNVHYIIKRYEQCTGNELSIFEDFSAKARGKTPSNLKSIIRRCLYLGFAYHADIIIGIAGIKVVPESKSWELAESVQDRHNYPYEIGFMYVVPEYRGQGINTSLVDLLLPLVDNQGVFLVTASENNIVINSFLKRGFTPAGQPYGSAQWRILKSKCEQNEQKSHPIV